MSVNPYEKRAAQVIVSVARPNSSGETETQTYTFEQHRMRINVRDGGAQFGNAQIEIFGVALDSMNQIARLWLEALTPQGTDTLTINIWDGESFSPFFQGIITWSAVNAVGLPLVNITIEANSAFGLTIVSASPYANAGPVRLKDVLVALGARGGFTIDYAASAPEYQITDVRLTGTPLEQIGQLMSCFPDLTWAPHLRTIAVRSTTSALGDDPVPINVSTGLMGAPTYSTSGLQFNTLFNPRIRIGVTLDVETLFDFVNRTVWVASVLAHVLEPNVPGGQWTTAVAASSLGAKGNNQS